MANTIHIAPPKGYRVKVVRVKAAGGEKMYDCQVFKSDNAFLPVLSTSMTCFEFKYQARQMGINRAWDIHNGATEWS